MKKLQLYWSEYHEYNSENVSKYVPTNAGVYKISFLQTDKTLAVRYVGQTNDLDRRLNEHLDLDNEQNVCLRSRLEKYSASFSFAEINIQNDRDGAELALYNHYKPVCNDPDAIPNGPVIEINCK